MFAISKQLVGQRFIYKIRSSRLRKSNWNLILPIDEARKNDEFVALADSQILRWIDELNNIYDADRIASEIREKIKYIKRQPVSKQTRKEIRQLYQELDRIQFKKDYMCLIIDREKDYHRACKGFSINGIKYKRLLGTNGGIKNSTIVFINQEIEEVIKSRIENGRDTSKELVPAKLEAYKALTCSASVPVSFPKGVLVVDDAMTSFKSDIVHLSNSDQGEPIMESRANQTIELDATDGCGMMLPPLAERWSKELGLEYTVSGLNTRMSFEKGMIFTFDFVDFANKVAGSYIVKDAWGNEVDIRNVELVMTTSMVKLWDSYKSCKEYIETSMSNHYTFGIAKTAPEELESERSLNYQFIQSFELSDEEINLLVKPTLDEFKSVLSDDWRKSVLFLRGSNLNDKNVTSNMSDFITALMVDRRVLNDSYVRSNIYNLIRKKIDEAKVGVIKTHGNYSIVSGDLYLLCQSMFGLPKTGLLKAGEIYNHYWAQTDKEELLCFRAPMTTHSNIRKVHPVRTEEASYWFRYIKSCTIFNSWDTASAALNGMDYDGDLVMLTDNEVLLNKFKPLPALMCAQKKAPKVIPSDEDLIKSNIDSFGNEIGQITNRVTSMYEIQSHYGKRSQEYKTLAYRICCGQLLQQDAIDKAKGIISKPMPREWYDKRFAKNIADESKRDLYLRIIADKKPYFMRYIYPALMKQYNSYIRNTNKNALREFKMTVDELYEIPMKQATQRQREFIKYFEIKMPVGTGDCIMNKICRIFEKEFDKFVSKHIPTEAFDYTIMKSDAEYTPYQYNTIKKLYEHYNRRLINYSIFTEYERTDADEVAVAFDTMNAEFREKCEKICPNASALCNIILDICYSKNSTKKFAWSMCGEEIIRNLLRKNNYILSYPARDDNGDIEYGAQKYALKQLQLKERFS